MSTNTQCLVQTYREPHHWDQEAAFLLCTNSWISYWQGKAGNHFIFLSQPLSYMQYVMQYVKVVNGCNILHLNKNISNTFT